MILEIENSKSIIFGGETYETSIDAKDLVKLKYIVSTALYSDNFSWIREITANSLDANVFVNSDKKVEIAFGTDNNGKYLYIRDYGIGLSPEFVENTFSKIGKSTKSTSNKEIGGWGLGRCSILAYQDSAFFISNYEGVEYTYMISKENGVTFNLLSSKPTDESNGTTVKVYIKKEWRETDTIITEIRNKCAYFEGIKCDYLLNPLVKNDNFLFSKDFDGDNSIHISLGGVYYNIPWDKLVIKPINISVAIPFTIGSLPVTPNREELRLEKQHLELIETKILNLMSYFKANVKTEFDNLNSYLHVQSYGSVEFVKGLIISYKDLGLDCIEYTPLKELKLKNILPNLEWSIINKTKIKRQGDNIKYQSIHNKQFLVNDKNYLNTKYFRQFVDGKKVIELPKFTLNKWKQFLELKRFPKSEWRRLINLYLDWFKNEFNVQTFTEIKESQEFKDYIIEEKAKVSKSIGIRRDSITWIARWNENDHSGNRKVVWDSNLSENTKPKVYVTNKTPKDKVEFLMSLIGNNMQLMKAKEEDYEWVEGDNIVAKVYYSLVLNKFLNDNKHWINIAKQCLDTQVNDLIKDLENFEKDNSVKISSENNQFKETLLKLITLHNLTDPISLKLTKIELLIIKYPYFKWMTYNYYNKSLAIDFHNYIQNLNK